jgi:transposase
MSSGELERVEVMGRVGSGGLKLSDAAVMLELSYRQTKRLWRRYRQVGRKGLKHGNAGRPSNRSKPMKLRRRVLNLIKKKYSGSEGERFGPTLAAEHLAEEDGLGVDHGDVAPLDVGGASMEPTAKAEETLPTKGAQGTLWRTGAAGREFP